MDRKWDEPSGGHEDCGFLDSGTLEPSAGGNGLNFGNHPAKLRNHSRAATHNPPPRLNLILFRPDEVTGPLLRTDPRAQHILSVLRRSVGETFDAGLINGPRGKGTIAAVGADELQISYTWPDPPPTPDPITLLVGLPRPQTARKILQDATTLGVAAIHFVATQRGEASYATSTLWTSGEWQRHLHTGAGQAFCTRIPEVTHHLSLEEKLASLPPAAARVALDNYEAPTALSQSPFADTAPIVVAFGAERGWSPAERDLLRAHQFTFAHLGPRVLRLETAVVAAIALLKARRGTM